MLAQLPWTFLNYRMFSRDLGFPEARQLLVQPTATKCTKQYCFGSRSAAYCTPTCAVATVASSLWVLTPLPLAQELQSAERRAFQDAGAATVLSRTDLEFAMRQFDLADDDAPVFLPPGIRQDVAAIPAPPDISRWVYCLPLAQCARLRCNALLCGAALS